MVQSVCTYLNYICLPEKIRRCCCGGIPSFSSTRSLMRSTLSVGSMSISISLPVSVYQCANSIAIICAFAVALSTALSYLHFDEHFDVEQIAIATEMQKDAERFAGRQ